MAKSNKHKKTNKNNMPKSTPEKLVNKGNGNKIAIISIISAFILIGFVVVAVSTNIFSNKQDKEPIPNTPEAVAEEFMNAYCSFDVDRLFACYPDCVWYNDTMEKARMLESLQTWLDYEARDYSKISYEISDIEVPSEEELASYYGELESYGKLINGFDVDCIVEIKTANVSLTRTDKYNQEIPDENTLVLINYNGVWSVFFPYLL